MNKIKIVVILLLLFSIVTTTYCAFVVSVTKNGSITTKELSTTFLSNNDLLTKVQNLDSTITSIDKNNDLTRSLSVPTISLTVDNIVSTSSSSVPIYLWIDSGTIYYYTIATTVDLNNV